MREVLRTALGVAAGPVPHQVEVVLMGEGLAHALWGVDGSLDRYFRSARAHGIRIYVEKDGLDDWGCRREDLAEGVEVVERREICRKLKEAQVHLKI